jgi:hypothetical protein
MSNIQKTRSWASLAACLAMTLAAATAIAQQDENQKNEATQDEQRQQTTQSDSNRDAERSASDQQSQRNEQSQRSQSRRNESSRDNDQWPNPQRYESDRDWRQTDRSRQGGLGVNIMSDDRDGVVVQHVHNGSPAEEMGVRSGDRITAINGRKVESTQDFISRIRNMQPGEEVELDIRRGRANGSEKTVSGELQSRKQALADHAQQADRYNQPDRWSTDSNRSSGQSDRYSDSRSRDDSQQTSFNEQSGRSQADSNRIDQLERQINRLSQQLNELRSSLQDLRRQGGSRERTARYEEFDSDRNRSTVDGQRSATSSRYDDDSDQQRSSSGEGESSSFRSNQRSSDSNIELNSPGGEIGEDRQHVDSEDLNE